MLRADAIKQATERGLLTHAQASAYLPAPITEQEKTRGNAIAGLLTGDVVSIPHDPEFKQRISELSEILKQKVAA